MKQFIQGIAICASILLAPLAMAKDEARITINVTNASAPVQVLNTYGSLGMEILEATCSNSMCSFKVIDSDGNSSYAHVAAITIGRDEYHACQLSFQNIGGFWGDKIALASKSCWGGWSSSDVQGSYVTINGN
jgi:hypothetical protein